MTKSNKWILSTLLVLLILALVAILYTREWEDSPKRLHADATRGQHVLQLVDTSAQETAQQLSALAVTHWERQYANDALRLGDQSVGLAFKAGLLDAEENPPAMTPETQAIQDRIKDAQARVDADQEAVKKLTEQLAKAPVAQKAALQDKLNVVQAQLALDQDELDGDHEDLVRAGGDKRALIQKQLDAYEAAQSHVAKPAGAEGAGANAGGGTAAGSGSAAPAAAEPASESPEYGYPKSLLKQIEAVLSMRTKEALLAQARQNALNRLATLTEEHDALEKQLAQEKSEKKIIRRKTKSSKYYAALQGAGKAGEGTKSSEAGESKPEEPAGALAEKGAKDEKETSVQSAEDLSQVEFIQRLNADQKMLALYDKRIAEEQALAKNYEGWSALVVARHHAFLHMIFVNVLWVVLIALFVFVSNLAQQKIFANVELERRQAATMRALFLVVTQAIGAVLILLVIFGVPNNFGTVAALAGAGITVAMKDFIVGFFGWFILMGKNGIHPGDWVEINGVGGEVLELGLLHTVLLETGSWADAGHPTGRKVTFVNSYAIEGHYFNFSTSGSTCRRRRTRSRRRRRFRSWRQKRRRATRMLRERTGSGRRRDFRRRRFRRSLR
jgi:hypothetical protein